LRKTLAEDVVTVRPDFPLLQWHVDDFESAEFGRPKAPRAPIPHEQLHRSALRASTFDCLDAFAAHWVEGG
jgi:hypothetical protein